MRNCLASNLAFSEKSDALAKEQANEDFKDLPFPQWEPLTLPIYAYIPLTEWEPLTLPFYASILYYLWEKDTPHTILCFGTSKM